MVLKLYSAVYFYYMVYAAKLKRDKSSKETCAENNSLWPNFEFVHKVNRQQRLRWNSKNLTFRCVDFCLKITLL